MSQNTPAEQLYQSIMAAPDKIALMRQWATERKTETDELDFKQQPREDDDQKLRAKWWEIWSECICGFANAGGGVVVWGVRAKSDLATKIDAADEVTLVENPLAVKSRLVQLQGEMTNPVVGNIQIEALNDPDVPGRGIVVCFVPSGPSKPYCTRLEGRDHRYVMRFGDSFRPMPRHLLQSLFYPKSHARFHFKLKVKLHDPRPVNIDEARYDQIITFYLKLYNMGMTTAKDVLVRFRAVLPFRQGNIVPTQEFTATNNIDNDNGFISKIPVHPQTALDVAHIQWLATGPDLKSMFGKPASKLNIVLTVYCNDEPPQRVVTQISLEQLVIETNITERLNCEPVELGTDQN